MGRFLIFTILLAIEFNSVIGIVVKQHLISNPEIFSGSTDFDWERNSKHHSTTTKIASIIRESHKKREPNKETIDNNYKIKDLPGLSATASENNGPLPKNTFKRVPITKRKTTYYSITNKPIHETDFDTNLGLFKQNPHFDGYFNRPPTLSNAQFIQETKKDKKNFLAADELASAIITLDRHLKPFSNPDSYNSDLHLPTNPILALILSQYGRYIPGSSPLYSYMAVNNIHNNKPFGQYKHECETDPIYPY